MAQIPLDKLESILDRSSELERSLSNELSSEDYVKLSKEYSEICLLYTSPSPRD